MSDRVLTEALVLYMLWREKVAGLVREGLKATAGEDEDWDSDDDDDGAGLGISAAAPPERPYTVDPAGRVVVDPKRPYDVSSPRPAALLRSVSETCEAAMARIQVDISDQRAFATLKDNDLAEVDGEIEQLAGRKRKIGEEVKEIDERLAVLADRRRVLEARAKSVGVQVQEREGVLEQVEEHLGKIKELYSLLETLPRTPSSPPVRLAGFAQKQPPPGVLNNPDPDEEDDDDDD